MDDQTQIVFNISQDPQSVETTLQERNCEPTPDESLPADAVLTDRMSDLEDSASSNLFIP